MCPDDERHEPEEDKRVYHRFVSPQRLTGIVRYYFCDNSHSRQDQHVHLRMSEEPEEVLPEQRVSSAGIRKSLSADNQTRGQEETCSGESIHELKNARRLKRREGEQQ